jgi:rhomboid family GlyGly-CTERM serine protease
VARGVLSPPGPGKPGPAPQEGAGKLGAARRFLDTVSPLAAPGTLAWLAVAAALLGPALWGGLSSGMLAAALDWRPGLWRAEPWRLWSAAWVHLNARHLGVNAAGAALVAALGVAARVDARAAWAWALAWPATHAALALQPGLARYAGLSGVLHAGVAVVALALWRGGSGRERRIGVAIGAGLLLKLVLEAPWAMEQAWSPELGMAVVPWAHAAGAVAGALAAGLLRARAGGPPVPRPA